MPNTLNTLMPKILAAALPVLRENCVLPRLINTSYSADAAKQGQEITIPITAAKVTQPVIPGAFSNATPDIVMSDVKLNLNYWEEVPFYLTDKDFEEIDSGMTNDQVSEAARAIANSVNASIFAEMYAASFNSVGIPGTTPFAIPAVGQPAAKEAIDAKKLLGRWLAPELDRYIVMNDEAEANALGLPLFQQYLQAGTDATVRDGRIDRKLGFDWYKDQIVPTATAPALNTLTTATVGATAVGAKSAILNAGTLTGSVKPGDIFRVAGDLQDYVITATATATGNQIAVSFEPGVNTRAGGLPILGATGWAASTAVTFSAAHALNFAFHKNAIGCAFRTMSDSGSQITELGGFIETMVDPVTGMPLRLEVKREHKRTRWSLDLLWGVKATRREHICRIRG